MEERNKEDEDGDPMSRAHQRKAQSFSQPLGRDAVVLAKRSVAVRKHSLDASAPTDPASSSEPSARSLSYPHYTYASSPPPSYHHHHSSSTDEIYYPHPNLPAPLPPNHQPNLHPNLTSPFSSSDGSSGTTLTLDGAMSEFGGAPGTLPEFMGTGGGRGIFRVPARAAMHPARPPALELRPHPLRETQFGSFLRTIASTDTQIWAGLESGLRFWNLSEVFESPAAAAKRGDEESAPFRESSGKMSPTICLVVDEASGLVWTGHKDGKIRSWKINKEAKTKAKVKPEGNDSNNPAVDGNDGGKKEIDGGGDGAYQFKEGLSWQAHRSPVLSMVISSYGKIRVKILQCLRLLSCS